MFLLHEQIGNNHREYVGVGKIVSTVDNENGIEIVVTEDISKLEKTIPSTLITDANYPDAPGSSKNKTIPMVLGDVDYSPVNFTSENKGVFEDVADVNGKKLKVFSAEYYHPEYYYGGLGYSILSLKRSIAASNEDMDNIFVRCIYSGASGISTDKIFRCKVLSSSGSPSNRFNLHIYGYMGISGDDFANKCADPPLDSNYTYKDVAQFEIFAYNSEYTYETLNSVAAPLKSYTYTDGDGYKLINVNSSLSAGVIKTSASSINSYYRVQSQFYNEGKSPLLGYFNKTYRSLLANFSNADYWSTSTVTVENRLQIYSGPLDESIYYGQSIPSNPNGGWFDAYIIPGSLTWDKIKDLGDDIYIGVYYSVFRNKTNTVIDRNVVFNSTKYYCLNNYQTEYKPGNTSSFSKFSEVTVAESINPFTCNGINPEFYTSKTISSNEIAENDSGSWQNKAFKVPKSIIDALQSGSISSFEPAFDLSIAEPEPALEIRLFKICLYGLKKYSNQLDDFYINPLLPELGAIRNIYTCVESLLTKCGISFATLLTLRKYRQYWHVGCTLTEQKTTREYLYDLCAQSYTCGFIDHTGYYNFITFDDLKTYYPIYDFTENNIIDGFCEVLSITSISELGTEYKIQSGFDYGGGEYKDIITVTNAESSTYNEKYVSGITDNDTKLTLWTQCHESYLKYKISGLRKKHESELYFFRDAAFTEGISFGAIDYGKGDQRSAAEFAKSHIAMKTKRHAIVKFNIPNNLSSINIVVGKTITLDHSDVTNSNKINALIIGTESDFTEMTKTIKCFIDNYDTQKEYIIDETTVHDTIYDESGTETLIINEVKK
jgi:hypothetical protein